MNELFHESSKEQETIDRLDPEGAKRRKWNDKRFKRK